MDNDPFRLLDEIGQQALRESNAKKPTIDIQNVFGQYLNSPIPPREPAPPSSANLAQASPDSPSPADLVQSSPVPPIAPENGHLPPLDQGHPVADVTQGRAALPILLMSISLDPDQPRSNLRMLLPRQQITHPAAALRALIEAREQGNLAAVAVLRGIEQLADDIAQHGLLQPVAVVKSDVGYRLLFGERRVLAFAWLAMQQRDPRWEYIHAVIYTQEELADGRIPWSENLKREDLPPIVLMQTLYQAYQDALRALDVERDYYSTRERLRHDLLNDVRARYQAITGMCITAHTARTWLRIIQSLDPRVLPIAACFHFPYRTLLSLASKPSAVQLAAAEAQARACLDEERGAKERTSPTRRRSGNVLAERHIRTMSRYEQQFDRLHSEARKLAGAKNVDLQPLIAHASALSQKLERYLSLLRSAASVH